MTVGRDLGRSYSGETSSATTYRLARMAHVRTAGMSSEVLFRMMRLVPGAVDRVSQDLIAEARSARAAELDELRDSGIAPIDSVLDGSAVERLRAFAERAPAKLRLLDGRVIDGTYESRHPATVAAFVPGTFAWANPEVQRVMASSRLHEIALGHTGLAPVVHTPTLYWSCRPVSTEQISETAAPTRRFHMDFDGVRAVRVHMYLTDVGDGNAPMQYVPGSHRPGSLRGRPFRQADLGLDDDVVTARFGASCARTITGPAGTTFVTDPRGLHRGTAPLDGDRLFLVTPIQAGSFAGYVRRRRSTPVRDDEFSRLLTMTGGPLRLFAQLAEPETAGLPTSVARLST
jgi:hypothetical protein